MPMNSKEDIFLEVFFLEEWNATRKGGALAWIRPKPSSQITTK
jgi:hypothetical protein